MLWKILSRINRKRFEPYVIALAEAAEMLPSFRQLGISCETLGMRAALSSVVRAPRLSRLLRAFRPDIVQGWMYHGNLAASAACAAGGLRVPVVWNVRATLIDRKDDKLLTAF